MKTAIFEIFRTGKHNGRNAKNINWSNEDLATVQRFYAENVKKAPLVIGHPEDNRPEYGVVKRLIHQNNALFAEAEVSDTLLHQIKADNFSGISASFYTPSNQSNPIKNLGYYLRHVGFLEKGKNNPAVKGMRDPKESISHLNFSETDGILYFCEDSTLDFNQNLQSKIHYLQNALDIDFATAYQLFNTGVNQ